MKNKHINAFVNLKKFRFKQKTLMTLLTKKPAIRIPRIQIRLH